MTLTPVDSSHIAAIGYLAVDRVLLVRYKTNHLFSFEGVGASAYDQLLIAPSKGKFLAAMHLPPGVLVTKGGSAEDSQSNERVAPLQLGPLGIINIIDEEAEKCCRKNVSMRVNSIAEWRTGDEVHCPVCTAVFRAEKTGTVVYWRIVECFSIVPPR